jgi:hypothetical protein
MKFLRLLFRRRFPPLPSPGLELFSYAPLCRRDPQSPCALLSVAGLPRATQLIPPDEVHSPTRSPTCRSRACREGYCCLKPATSACLDLHSANSRPAFPIALRLLPDECRRLSRRLADRNPRPHKQTFEPQQGEGLWLLARSAFAREIFDTW